MHREETFVEEFGGFVGPENGPPGGRALQICWTKLNDL
jgi:hypothetical protein